MKKHLSIFLMIATILATALLFTACGDKSDDKSDDKGAEECQHEGGAATCTEQAVCEKCEKPYGEALGHDWIAATCDTPKTCDRDGCGITEGEALGHDWIAATCDTPKTCDRDGCGVTEGEALGHSYAKEWTIDETEHKRACELHPDAIERGAHEDTDENDLCDTCGYKMFALYTLSAKDASGAPLNNASFVISKNEEPIETVITDNSGAVSVKLPTGEYTVEISHLSVFFKTDSENVTLTVENCSYEATFTESAETELVWVTPTYDDGTPLESGKAHVYLFFNGSTYDASLLGINSQGQAATFMYNEPCIIWVLDTDGNYGYGEFNKNDPTDIKLTVKKGIRAGSSAEHPLLVNTLVDLPFNVEDMLFSYEHQMKSGESLFLSIKKATTKTFTIDGNAFTLEYKGEEITPDEDGTIRLCFDDVVYGEDAVVKITAKEDATENIEIID